MKPDNLLDHADRLCRATRSRPRQVDLKRAVSAAYYAAFHALCLACANSLVGTGRAAGTDAGVLAYRSVAHGQAKTRCRTLRPGTFPPGIRNFAKAFVTLQDERHRGDYDPWARMTRSEAIELVERARSAVEGIEAASRPDRLAFAAYILFPPR